ncbi:MAG: hypothetical protein CR974_03760 [Gammaproteobacteria bacterium]|nr:MAG: hypothetical protein CR974_03760 [Gammaproteobacteria bacterium]
MNTVSQQAQDVFVSTATLLERKGREEGLTEGRKAGRREFKEEIALSMLEEGVQDSLILKLTKLSREQLKRLKMQIANTRS